LWLVLLAGLTLSLLVVTFLVIEHSRTAFPAQLAAGLSAPQDSDWTDYGQIFEAGEFGQWDYQLFGAFTNSAIKKGETFYLYYQGASGYRIEDDTVTWRAIGAATSPDGINFTKYDNNPIISWFPTLNGEEGAVSAGVTLDDDGTVMLYYGANTAAGPTKVHADGRLATSADGLLFDDQGIVLDHNDGSVWGSGDELFPVLAIHDASQWILYYIPNGTLQARKLGVAWGAAPDELNDSSAASSGILEPTISAWGTAGKARLDESTYALFINNVPERKIEVRTMSPSAPNQLSDVIETYPLEDIKEATVLLDEESQTWFMYYRNADSSAYGVKLAPFGEPDTSPPTAPITVTATAVSDRQIDLSWEPATDPETGIVLYNVLRDGQHLETVKGWAYSDTGLVEQTEYSYEISAVNYHGVEGPHSAPIGATTLVDVTRPGLESVNASGRFTQVTVAFDEPVEKASAEAPENYSIGPDVLVAGASLNPDLKSVVLTTSKQCHGKTYSVMVNGVKDRAETPNLIPAGTTLDYTYSHAAGLAGAWNFDEGSGEIAFDTSNFQNDGRLIYTDQPGPSWTAGKIGGALEFDGLDDQVTIDGSGSLEDVTDGSHSFEAWVYADSVPPFDTWNDVSYSILVRQKKGLRYDHDRKFGAEIRVSDGENVSVSSATFEPRSWHHLVMVVDDIDKQLHLYVDGQEVDDSPVAYPDMQLADHEDAPYYVGTSNPLDQRYEQRFKGKIDEARIYNGVLSPEQVQLLYTGPTCFEALY
ncbi:MAG: hypothetical protein JSW55_01570, partial [Chloroflexota bacterium]